MLPVFSDLKTKNGIKLVSFKNYDLTGFKDRKDLPKTEMIKELNDALALSVKCCRSKKHATGFFESDLFDADEQIYLNFVYEMVSMRFNIDMNM